VATPGTYRIRIAASAGGVTRTVTKSVSVTTALVNRRRSAARDGSASSTATRGSCYATRDSDYGTTALDCWGGRYAMARYNFRVPASAFGVTWRSTGHLAEADICCTGKVSRTGTRVSSRVFQVRVTATGWRAFDVTGASMSYSYKVRR